MLTLYPSPFDFVNPNEQILGNQFDIRDASRTYEVLPVATPMATQGLQHAPPTFHCGCK